jgi:AAA15 family ATPase/GTPase
MLTSIQVQGFKGFRDTKISELRRVNLILGGQNSGKTSLLESIYLGYKFDPYEFSLPLKTSDTKDFYNHLANVINETGFRLSPSNRAMSWIKSSNSKLETKIFINEETKFNYKIDNEIINFTPIKINARIACFNVYPIHEKKLVDLYIHAVKTSRKEDWLRMLRLIEPRLADLDQFPPDGETDSVVHAKIGLHELIPLSELGQGFNRLAYLYAGLLGQNSEIALIDEIENGIHYSALPILWQGIANIARELNIQVFATTHSKECIEAAAKVFESTPEEFQLVRLDRTKDNNIEATQIADQDLAVLLKSNMEVR